MFGRLKPDRQDSRSIDGMRDTNTPENGAVLLDVNDLPWMEETKDVAGEAKLTAEQQQAKNQQDKIIAFFSIDAKTLVTPEEIVGLGSKGLRDLKRKRLQDLRRMTLETEDPQVTAEQRKEFLRKLRSGEISRADEANFLLLIRDPLNTPSIGAEKMFEKIAADPRQIQILAVAAGYNLKNWQKMDAESLDKLLGTVQVNGDDYRTPVGFRRLEKYFLDGIRTKAKGQVYQCYVQSMKELEKTLYGKRYAYYKQFEELRRLAQNSTEVEQEDSVGVSRTAKVEIPKRVTKEKFTRLLTEKSSEMLGRAVIDGDVWRGNGKEEYLSTHDLAEMKLGPMYEVVVGEMKICLSTLFRLPSGQLATVAYVPEGRSWKVRSYYQNNDIGLWCYLPSYVRSKDGRIESCGLGYSMASVILPLPLQVALRQIEEKFSFETISDAEFVFAGTAQAWENGQDKLGGDYAREVSADAINHDFEVYGRGRKKAPYTLGIDYRRSPDFGQCRARFVTSVTDAGRVQVEGFSSHDGQMVWVFCSDSKGRTWIAHVEVMSPLTSLGLRRDWAIMGDFVTPLYEYTSRAGIYGDRDDTRGPKQCMWNNYLSNVPLIQQYVGQKD